MELLSRIGFEKLQALVIGQDPRVSVFLVKVQHEPYQSSSVPFLQQAKIRCKWMSAKPAQQDAVAASCDFVPMEHGDDPRRNWVSQQATEDPGPMLTYFQTRADQAFL